MKSALQWTEEAAEFAAFFPANPFKYGVHLGVDAQGNKKVITVDRQTLGEVHLLEHLHGVTWHGWLPHFGETGTQHVMLDLDSKDFTAPDGLENALLRLNRVLREFGFEHYLARSTRGQGYHLHVFLEVPVQHHELKLAFKHLLLKAGLPYKTEVFPKGGADSNWFFMPYFGALQDERGLGRTFLETSEQQAIPVWELGEYISFSPVAGVMQLLEECKSNPVLPVAAGGDLAPEAFEVLQQLALAQGPDGSRHDTLAAFLNLASRCGHLTQMVEVLQLPQVHALWTAGDGSRSLQAWREEIQRWAAAVANHAGVGYGIPFLRAVGYEVPRLPFLEQHLTLEQRILRVWASCSTDEQRMMLKCMAVSAARPGKQGAGLPEAEIMVLLQKFAEEALVADVVTEVLEKLNRQLRMKGRTHLETVLLPEWERRPLKRSEDVV